MAKNFELSKRFELMANQVLTVASLTQDASPLFSLAEVQKLRGFAAGLGFASRKIHEIELAQPDPDEAKPEAKPAEAKPNAAEPKKEAKGK